MSENEYQPFFNDLLSEYQKAKAITFRELLIIFGDRLGRHWQGWDDGNVVEEDVKSKYIELVDSEYNRHFTCLNECANPHTKDELKNMLKEIKGDGGYDVIFHGMYHIVQNAIYFSISKLNPQMHEINIFFCVVFEPR